MTEHQQPPNPQTPKVADPVTHEPRDIATEDEVNAKLADDAANDAAPTGTPPEDWDPDAHETEYREDLDVIVTGEDDD